MPAGIGRPTLGWILGGTGLGLGAASLAVYLVSSAKFHEYETEQSELYRLNDKGVDTTSRQGSNDDRANSIRALDNLAAGLAGAGAGLAVGGALLLLLPVKPPAGTTKGAAGRLPLELRLGPRQAAEVSWSAYW